MIIFSDNEACAGEVTPVANDVKILNFNKKHFWRKIWLYGALTPFLDYQIFWNHILNTNIFNTKFFNTNILTRKKIQKKSNFPYKIVLKNTKNIV